MSKNAIDKIQKTLIKKRKKYKILSIFYKTKALVVDFIDFKKISNQFILQKIELKKASIVSAFFPKTIGQSQESIDVRLPTTNAFLLQNLLISSQSSLLLSTDKEKAYYEGFSHANDTEFVYDNIDVKFHSLHLAKINNYKIKKRSEKVVVLNTWFEGNYFHIIIELLSKVQFLQSLPIEKNCKIILGNLVGKNPNYRVLVDIFLKDFDVEYLDKNKYYRFDEFWVISSPNKIVPNLWQDCKYQADYAALSPDSLHYIRNTISDFYKDNVNNYQKPSKIFLARKSGARQYNESEILEIAVKMGFTPIYFEDLSIEQQVVTMQHADYILGPSGAAWTNLLFAKPKAKALIWMGTIWNNFSVFSTIAEIMDVDLSYHRNVSQSKVYHEDYNLDPVVMEDLIQKLLNKI